ncbi:hypothetical protein AB2B38_007320 [Balneola sp. MJW-20]|uniref:hypothetical protein n=1 Tax=Gracilimonas aurantiaca TaxID=3234185 RepID=UPI003467D658
MERIFKRLLSEIIDYAGLFPPAALPMPEALDNYLDYKLSSHNWMLSRFVVGVNHLNELVEVGKERISVNDIIDLTITVPQIGTINAFGQQIDKVINQISATRKALKPRTRTHMLEVKLPMQIKHVDDPKDILKIIERAVAPMTGDPNLPNRIFFEIPDHNFDIRVAIRVIKAIAMHNMSAQKRKLKNYLFSGLKIRCGGQEASHVPPADYLAKLMLIARDANVPVKFTAGLHHPYRHYDDQLNIDVHGFLNVFCTGILAYTQDITVEEATEILSDKNPDHFKFSKDSFSWKEFEAPILEVKLLRMLSLISFGSCSFTEPVEELRHLKLI